MPHSGRGVLDLRYELLKLVHVKYLSQALTFNMRPTTGLLPQAHFDAVLAIHVDLCMSPVLSPLVSLASHTDTIKENREWITRMIEVVAKQVQLSASGFVIGVYLIPTGRPDPFLPSMAHPIVDFPSPLIILPR
jgi:hypothetical protein